MAFNEYIAAASSTLYDKQGLKKPVFTTIMSLIQDPPEARENGKPGKPNEYPEHDGWCWAAISTIAARIGCDERTVKEYITEYIKDGWLVMEKWTKDGNKRLKNRYKPTPGAIERLQEMRLAKGEKRIKNPNMVRDPKSRLKKNGQFTSANTTLGQVMSEPKNEPIPRKIPHFKDNEITSMFLEPVRQPEPVKVAPPAPFVSPYRPREPYVPYVDPLIGAAVDECVEAIVDLFENDPPVGEFKFRDRMVNARMLSRFNNEPSYKGGLIVEKAQKRLIDDGRLVEGDKPDCFTWHPHPVPSDDELEPMPKPKLFEIEE